MFYRYEHYMSISHMAVSSVNCEYGIYRLLLSLFILYTYKILMLK